MSPTGDDPRATGASDIPDPEADRAFRVQVDRVADEKREAEEAPDVPWREWWFHSGSKWYVGLGMFILDVWVLTYAYESVLYAFGLALLALALGGEFVLYQYLYHRPGEDGPHASVPFRPTWIRPFRFGRWTVEGDIVRAGGTVPVAEQGPDPNEFL